MVGYEIEHLSETGVAKRGDHLTEVRRIAELWVELAVVYDVIAMGAAGPCFQIRRSVDVADAEPRQIGSEGCGIPEIKSFVELQAVGRPWDRCWTGLRHVRLFRRRFRYCAQIGKSQRCR